MLYILIFISSWFLPTTISTIVPIVSSENIAEQSSPNLIQFDTELIKLGVIERGDIKEFDFHFTNVGKEDLEIEFMSSCDCTTLDYPMDVIAPGEKGVIHVHFDSSEKTESEMVDIDIDLVNKDPKTGDPIFIRINYSFIFE